MTAPVLVVDDSLTVRKDLREALEGAGLRVVECDTVAAARRAIAGAELGVVVLDVLLPDGDGISLLEEIRRSSLNARVPVMLLSTEAEVRDRIRGLSRGADEYIAKPYDSSYVVARTRELLGCDERTPHERRTILLVDDSPSIRDELGRALDAAGYRVVTAETGEKGLLVAAEARPDAVILDGVLPGIDGQAVLRRMKLDATLRRTPVLMLTASERPGDELQALEAGADGFVRKDEEIGAILARVAAMLRGEGRRRGAELAASSLGPKRILAIDDNPADLELISAELRQEGCDVVAARSAEEALDLLAVQRVDCIVLDLLMPGLSGHETCRRIRASEGCRDVPIIILSSREDRAALIESINAGADDYVSKSVDFDVLRARIRAQLRRRQIEEENRAVHEQLLRQEREAAEARAAQELAAVRAELLADLERKNLELREADRHKNEFLGVLSHELRNPLAAIRQALWLIERTDPSGEKAGRAKGILRRQIGQLMRLVDDLLDVTRVSRGKIRLQRSRCDLAELVRRAADDHEPLLAEREVALDLRIEPEPLLMDADPARIVQIVGNLLQNSAKFTDPGGRVTVTAQRDAEAAIVAVADTGVGISPEMLGRLFEPFAQGKETLQRSSGGLGLGLALVKGLVELHGGTVAARSGGVGLGARFELRLPLASGRVDGKELVFDSPPAPPRRILIIDDNVDSAQSLRDVLALAGHEVEVAHDGCTGLQKARAFRPHVALCDIGLPGMDGYAVARAIRSDPALAAIALVAFTGYSRPDDKRRAAEAGFDSHLAKPATIAQLEHALSTATSAQRT